MAKLLFGACKAASTNVSSRFSFPLPKGKPTAVNHGLIAVVSLCRTMLSGHRRPSALVQRGRTKGGQRGRGQVPNPHEHVAITKRVAKRLCANHSVARCWLQGPRSNTKRSFPTMRNPRSCKPLPFIFPRLVSPVVDHLSADLKRVREICSTASGLLADPGLGSMYEIPSCCLLTSSFSRN